MSYKIALERLKAYEPKRLLRGVYEEVGECCVVGVVCPVTRHYLDSPIDDMILEVANVAADVTAAGLTPAEAHDLQEANDDFMGDMEARYVYVLEWLETQVACEPCG